jgi:hypothetical protein
MGLIELFNPVPPYTIIFPMVYFEIEFTYFKVCRHDTSLCKR